LQLIVTVNPLSHTTLEKPSCRRSPEFVQLISNFSRWRLGFGFGFLSYKLGREEEKDGLLGREEGRGREWGIYNGKERGC
jgi:hypothetical protein